MTAKVRIAPCLWFDTRAEEAARFYVSIFADSAILAISRFGKEGFEVHGRNGLPGISPAATFRSGHGRQQEEDGN